MDGEVVPLDLEGDRDESLDTDQESFLAALQYGSAPATQRRVQPRRLKGKDKFDPSEFFDDPDQIRGCEVVYLMVQDAMSGDDWALEWLFGASQLCDENFPPREELMTLFGARDYVLQTRVAYAMWSACIEVEMKFPMQPLPRSFMLQVTGTLAEHNCFDDPRHSLAILDAIWAHQGIPDKDIEAAYRQTAISFGLNVDAQSGSSPSAEFLAALSYMEMDRLISKSSKGGWYCTGRNPIRHREEMMRDHKTSGFIAMNRGWSSWF